MDVLADKGSDMKTVQYRQDVLQDLVSSERLLDSVQRIASLLNRMAELGALFHWRTQPDQRNSPAQRLP